MRLLASTSRVPVASWFVWTGLIVSITGVAKARAEKRACDSFNYVLGTQTFAPKYGFSQKTRLVETADAIQAMGSNILKFDMSVRAFASYRLPRNDTIHSLTQMARDEPSCRRVLHMPFAHYLVWTYCHSVPNAPWHSWRNALSPFERAREYCEVFDFTKYLLTEFNGSGKTFLLGHWEGDWALLGSFDRRRDPSPEAIQGMIDWLNVRQQAVDDAKRSTEHQEVEVYHYTEVNLVRKAIDGGRTVTNDVLPQTHVDFVSYSSYDALHVGGRDRQTALHESLDYIVTKLPAKASLKGKRVFIGEYGFPLVSAGSPEAQAAATRDVMRAGLAWGCPFVLYWQMYCNEKPGGQHRGFWLIDEQGRQQPAYATHRQFLARAKQYVGRFRQEHGRLPTACEYSSAAQDWLLPQRANNR